MVSTIFSYLVVAVLFLTATALPATSIVHKDIAERVAQNPELLKDGAFLKDVAIRDRSNLECGVFILCEAFGKRMIPIPTLFTDSVNLFKVESKCKSKIVRAHGNRDKAHLFPYVDENFDKLCFAVEEQFGCDIDESVVISQKGHEIFECAHGAEAITISFCLARKPDACPPSPIKKF